MQPLREVRRVFDDFKTVDGRGEFLAPSALIAALWELQINPIFAELKMMRHEADVDGDGRVDFQEFKGFYIATYRDYATNPQRALSLFLKLDRNGDGVLDRNEFREALGLAGGESMIDAEFEQFWDEIDVNHNGTLSAAEFTMWVCPAIELRELNTYLIAYNLEPIAADEAVRRSQSWHFDPHRHLGSKSRSSTGSAENRASSGPNGGHEGTVNAKVPTLATNGLNNKGPVAKAKGATPEKGSAGKGASQARSKSPSKEAQPPSGTQEREEEAVVKAPVTVAAASSQQSSAPAPVPVIIPQAEQSPPATTKPAVTPAPKPAAKPAPPAEPKKEGGCCAVS